MQLPASSTALLFLLPSLAAGQAILASGGRTLFNKSLLFRSFTRIQRHSISSKGELGRSTRYVQPLAVVYGIAPDWNVTAVAPFVVAESTGWADAQFFAKYDGLFKKNQPGGLTRLALEFGLQAPTGTDPFSTGAFGFSPGLVFEKASNQKFFLADIQYNIATRNDEGVTVDNSTGFDLAVAYLWLLHQGQERGGVGNVVKRLLRHGLFCVLELNGEVHNRARTRHEAIGDSGGATLLLSPGLQYFPRSNFVADFSVPIPVLRELNGVQPRPSVGFLVGFRYLL